MPDIQAELLANAVAAQTTCQTKIEFVAIELRTVSVLHVVGLGEPRCLKRLVQIFEQQVGLKRADSHLLRPVVQTEKRELDRAVAIPWIAAEKTS